MESSKKGRKGREGCMGGTGACCCKRRKRKTSSQRKPKDLPSGGKKAVSGDRHKADLATLSPLNHNTDSSREEGQARKGHENGPGR